MYLIADELIGTTFRATTLSHPKDPLNSIHLFDVKGRTTVKGDISPFCFYGNTQQAIAELSNVKIHSI